MRPFDSPRQPAVCARGAFTLVELLVVIGLIAVLIGLLMPSLVRARLQAQTVQCASQLRQLGMAFQLYATNNSGYLPGWSGWQVAGGDGTGEDNPGLGWTEQLEPYFAAPTASVYNCPSFVDEPRINYFLSARWTFMVDRRNLRLSEIARSSEFVLSGDCTQPNLYPPAFGTAWDYVEDDCDKDDATQRALIFFGESEGRNFHSSGNNVLFADGHVATFLRYDPQLMTYHPRKMQDWDEVTE